jgi:acyl-CoA synthetase (NDP forming)
VNLSRLFAPASIAVVGATDRAGSYGNAVVTNLLDAGYTGHLVGVHPTRTEVRGVPCVPSLEDAGSVDAVVIATPADTVPSILESAGRLRCGGAIVFAADFAETGRHDRQELLVAAATRNDLPVVGPNANGVVALHSRAPMWGDPIGVGRAGGVALITQSGNLGDVALASRRGISWHTVVSVGNSAIVDAAHALRQLAETEGIRSVALYLEGDGDGARWAEAFAACAENDVRFAVLKAGRSAAGAAAGGAHTAAVAGDHRIFSALVAEAGGAWCHDPHELFETAKTLALPRPARTGGLAVVTCSGGDSVITADEADRLGVPLARLSVETESRLAALLPEGVVVTNPLDHTNMLWADTSAIRDLCETLAADPAVNQVLQVLDTPEDLSDEDAVEWAATRSGLEQAVTPGVGRAVASGLPELMPADVASELGTCGVAAIGGIPAALHALKAHTLGPADPERLREIAATSRSVPSGDWLAEHEGKQLLARYGVAVPRGEHVTSADAAVAAASRLREPLAMKVSHPEIQHKSDIGGVLLGVRGPDAVAEATDRLLDLRRDGVVLVEEMAGQGLELLVSATREGVVPSLVIGTGGIWTEVLRDAVVVPLPAAADRIEHAARSLRAWPMLGGGRGQDRLAVSALCQLAEAVGRALLLEPLSLVELNPVIVTVDGAVAVDAVVRR